MIRWPLLLRSAAHLACALALVGLASPLLAQGDPDYPNAGHDAGIAGPSAAEAGGEGTGLPADYDRELTSTLDFAGQYIYFNLQPDLEVQQDRDVYRLKLPAAGQSVPEDQYERVTSHWGLDTFARPSPDGRLMIYSSDRDRIADITNPFYWDQELYLKDFQSGELKRLTMTFNDRELAPSMDDAGGRMVYMADSFARQSLRLYWADIATPWARTLLKQGLDKKTFAIISPDGKFVYFNALPTYADGTTDVHYDIFRIELATLKEENVTNTKGISELHVDLTSDGNTMVYERHYKAPAPGAEELQEHDPGFPSNLLEIYLHDVRTARVTRLTENTSGEGFPTISRDGQWVIFQAAREDLDNDGRKDFELFALNVKDKQEWKISTMAQSHDFVAAGF